MSVLTMFSRNPTPRPLAASVETIERPIDEYRRLADKLGIALDAKPNLAIEDILQREMIHVYNLKDVSRYMDKITPSGKCWCWMPLRNVDRERSGHNITFGFNSKNGRFGGGIYSKPVPMPVLLTIDRVEDSCRDAGIQPAFFVSDYTARMPDPFLLVGIPDQGMQDQQPNGDLWLATTAAFVIERWDEPSFRER